MADQLFPSSDTLLRLLDIGQDDILANRAGHVGARQRSGTRRTLVFVALGAAVLGAGLMAGGLSAKSVVPIAMGAVVLMVAVVAVAGIVSGGRAPVQCVIGTVEVVLVPAGRGQGTGLRVGGQTYPVPMRLRSTHEEWQAAIGPDPYRVYVAGSSANVVGIEPGVR